MRRGGRRPTGARRRQPARRPRGGPSPHQRAAGQAQPGADAADPDPPDGKRRTGQDISDLLASVLRIDVDHREAGKNFAVPKDNPFFDKLNARPEIWAYGLRNPWKISFDRVTGKLWCGDVGWEQWENVYLIERGGNYGWSAKIGRAHV